MATTIFFNGRVTAIPGSYSEIDASGLAVVALGANGIIGCIGESEGGSPWNGGTPIHSITNPGKVGRTFRDGDLKEAGNILFDPSKDPDIPGGAQEVKFVKVNPATQSTLTLVNGDGDVLDLTSIDYGLFTTQISIVVAAGTTIGQSITITEGDTEEIFDDVGGTAVFTALYTPGTYGADTMLLSLDNTVGVDAQWTRTNAGLASEYDGTFQTVLPGLDDEFAATIVGGNVVDCVSDDNGDTFDITIVGIESGGGLPETEVLTLTGTTPVVGTTTWSKVLGVIIGGGELRGGDVVVNDNGATVLLTTLIQTVYTRGVNSFSDNPMEVGGGVISLISSGASTDDVILLGSDLVPATQAETITLTGVVLVAGVASWSAVQYVVLGDIPAAQNLTISGLIWNSTDVAEVVSSDNADIGQTVTVYGLDSAGEPQSEVLTLNGTTAVPGTATWSKILGVLLSAAAVGAVTCRSGTANGVDAYVIAIAALHKGLLPVDNVAVYNNTVSWTDNGAEDRDALLIGLDADGASQIVKVTSDGTTQVPVETWSEITGIALGHVAAAAVTVSGEAFDLSTVQYETVAEVATYINGLGGWTFTIGANAGLLDIDTLDNQANANPETPAAIFTGDLAFMLAAFNTSQMVSAAVATGATGAPTNIGPVYLSGGIEGVTAFADWQGALDLLRAEFVNTVVTLTSDAAVHAAAVSHAVFMAGPGRKERDVCLGTASGTTKADGKAAAVALNTRHARLCIQDMVRFNTDGVREQFPPYFHACIAAGQQAGSSVGTPLTFKFTSVLDVVGDDDTYTLLDDADELIQAGILVQEKVQGVGFRWLRNITTHLIDNNLAFIEASMNEAVNFSAQNIRTALEDAVGRKGFAGTVNAAASIVIQALGLLSDPQDPIIVAWRNLTIELENDVLTVDVELAPVGPVNFVKTTIHLVTATFAAAA